MVNNVCCVVCLVVLVLVIVLLVRQDQKCEGFEPMGGGQFATGPTYDEAGNMGGDNSKTARMISGRAPSNTAKARVDAAKIDAQRATAAETARHVGTVAGGMAKAVANVPINKTRAERVFLSADTPNSFTVSGNRCRPRDDILERPSSQFQDTKSWKDKCITLDSTKCESEWARGGDEWKLRQHAGRCVWAGSGAKTYVCSKKPIASHPICTATHVRNIHSA
jgi:hypothetical protein